MRASRTEPGKLISSFVCAALLLAATAALAGPNQAPSAALTSPAHGAGYIAPATVELAATASDTDGTVVRVDFFQGNTLIGTSSTPPYAATWSNVAAGSYTLTAKAVDNQGGIGTSAPVSITVASAMSLVITSPLDGAAVNISSGLNVSGTYEGPSTGNTILVDDPARSALATITGNSYSASLFGGISIGANTITVRLARADRSHVTRTITVFGYATPVVAFTAPSSAVFEAPATVTFRVDAKAPGGSVTQVQFLRNGTPVGTVTAPPYEVTLSNLTNGNHTITANATSSRGPVGGANTTIQVLGPNTPPTISITSPASSATFTAPATIPIAVSAADPDGTVTLVEHFANGGQIGASNVSPFGITWSNVAAGSYSLTSRATDDRSGQTTSAPVNITVFPPNQPPVVEFSSPSSGSSFGVPGPVTLTANASDPDGTINRVEYYFGTTFIGSSTTPPYAVNWTMVVPGTYQLTAKAFDNQGRDGVSQPITVTISGSITYLHSDFAGNPIAATDVNGAIVWKENFRPYGDRLNNQAAAASNRQWFHGKAVDVDTGLSYFGARYYDSSLGRFMGVDSIGFKEDNPHSFNRYAYGNNNPYRFGDPKGDSPIDVIFWLADAAQLAVAINSGVGIGTASVDFAISTAALLSPIPGAGQGVKALRAADKVADAMKGAGKEQTFQRVVSSAELQATRDTGLLRGGREGENFFTNNASLDAKRAHQRLGLDGPLRDHRIEFKIKNDIEITGPRTAKPGKSGTPGGGREFSTQGPTEIEIIRVDSLGK